MNPKLFAKELMKNNINFKSVELSSDEQIEDHSITITDKVTIQVPVFGNEVGVVAQCSDGFLFYDLHHQSDFTSLKKDIAKALEVSTK